VERDPADDEDQVGHEEDDEDRQQRHHRFLDPADVERDEQQDQEYFAGEFPHVHCQRQEAEERIPRGRDRDRDRHHVVDEQCATREDTRPRAEELARDKVPAAAMRERLDDAPVGGRDDEHRDRGQQAEVRVLPERMERFRRTIGRRRQPVGSEANPCEEGDQRHAVNQGAILEIARLAEEDVANACCSRLRRCGQYRLAWSRRGAVGRAGLGRSRRGTIGRGRSRAGGSGHARLLGRIVWQPADLQIRFPEEGLGHIPEALPFDACEVS
jgi:hypothetical protein